MERTLIGVEDGSAAAATVEQDVIDRVVGGVRRRHGDILGVNQGRRDECREREKRAQH